MGYLTNKRIKSGSSDVTAAASVVTVTVNGLALSHARKSSDGSAHNSTYLPEYNRNDGNLHGNKNCHIYGSGDSAQPSNIIGDADLRLIEGGYDNTIFACPASCILGSNHSVIQGTSNHAFISSGSTIIANDLSYGGVQSGLYVTVSGRGTFAAGCEGESAANPDIINGNRTSAISNRDTHVVGDDSFAAGNDNCNLTADNAVLIGSFGCTVQGNYSSVIGGRDCWTTDVRSTAKGFGAIAYAPSMDAKADGYKAVPGDQQSAIVGPFRGLTTGAGYKDFRLNHSETDPTGSGARFPIRDGSKVYLKYEAFGSSSDATEQCVIRGRGIYYNDGGTIIEKLRETDYDGSKYATDANMSVRTDNSGNVFEFTGRGKSGVEMDWVLMMEILEISN